MIDIEKIEDFCDALKNVVNILWDMDEETLEAINDRNDIDGDARVDELSDWLRFANWSKLQDEKTKQLCRFLNDYWEKNPDEASATYVDVNRVKQYLSKVSGLSVSYKEAEAALDLWDYTEGEI